MSDALLISRIKKVNIVRSSPVRLLRWSETKNANFGSDMKEPFKKNQITHFLSF